MVFCCARASGSTLDARRNDSMFRFYNCNHSRVYGPIREAALKRNFRQFYYVPSNIRNMVLVRFIHFKFYRSDVGHERAFITNEWKQNVVSGMLWGFGRQALTAQIPKFYHAALKLIETMAHKWILLIYVIDSGKFNIWDFRYGTFEHQNDFNFVRWINKIPKIFSLSISEINEFFHLLESALTVKDHIRDWRRGRAPKNIQRIHNSLVGIRPIKWICQNHNDLSSSKNKFPIRCFWIHHVELIDALMSI